MAARGAPRAFRHGGVRLGSGLADGRRDDRWSPRCPCIPRRSAARRARLDRDTSVLVHLRRPSKLSTLQLADTQPFLDRDGRFAFSHNGDLRRHREHRQRFLAQGRIGGRADSEVGARWLEDSWAACATAGAALRALHDTFGGQANLAVLAADGTVVHYAGNTENPVFSFRLGTIGLISTALYSIDRSLFTLAAPGARHRRLIRPGSAAALDPLGEPVPA